MSKSKKSKIEPVHEEEAGRLKALFAERTNMSQEAFGAAFGIGSQGMVWQYLNHRSPLNLEAALKFARGLNCSVGDFSQRLADELLPSSDTQNELERAESRHDNDNARAMLLRFPNTTPRTVSAKNSYQIPQYAAGGSMGHGLVLPDQPGVIENWSVSREWMNKNVRNITGPDNLCIVTGFGPSMQPMFNPGDPLLVDRGVKSVIADGIYFFRVGDEGFVKQLQKIPTAAGIKYIAKSKNKDFDTFEITPDMDFEVLGRVVRVWCGTDF